MLVADIPHESSPWRAAVGATGLMLPRYDGASRYLFFPLPLAELSYKDVFTASVLDGVEVNLFRHEAFTAGPLVRIDFTQRVPRDRPAPWAGTFYTSVEGGAFAEYRLATPFPLKLRAEVLQSFNAHLGLDAKFAILGTHELLPDVTLEAGPVVHWGNRLSLDSRFGVDALSGPGGWPAFSPGAGFASYGVESEIEWRVNKTIRLTAIAEYERLTPHVASSPIVQNGGSPNQFALGLSLAYRFNGP